MSGQGFYAPGHCDLDLLTPKSLGIISWPFIPQKVYLGEISLKLIADKTATTGLTDGQHAP